MPEIVVLPLPAIVTVLPPLVMLPLRVTVPPATWLTVSGWFRVIAPENVEALAALPPMV
jgi:hypothetical protein